MLGLTGAILLTVATVPQAFRLIRSRSADDFSWGYIALSLAGCLLLTTHAIRLGDLAFSIVNGTGIAFWGLVAFMRLQGAAARYKTGHADGPAHEQRAQPS